MLLICCLTCIKEEKCKAPPNKCSVYSCDLTPWKSRHDWWKPRCFSVAALKCWGESEAWEAHLLCTREGVIEAGYIGHYGLLIRPQRTHDVYASPSSQQERERSAKKGKQKERERQSEANATQSYMVLAPCRIWEQGLGRESGSLWRSTAPPPSPAARRDVRGGWGVSSWRELKDTGVTRWRLGHKHTSSLNLCRIVPSSRYQTRKSLPKNKKSFI